MSGPSLDPTAWFGEELGAAQRARLQQLGRPTSYVAGAEIVREGVVVTDMGIVTRGRLALRLFVPGRGQLTILTVEPGDVFDWSAVVPPYRASSTIVAVEPTEAIAYDAAALRTALAEDPQLAAIVYPRLLAAVSRRLQATRLQLLDLFAAEGSTGWK